MSSLMQRDFTECTFELLGGKKVIGGGWEIFLASDHQASSIPIKVGNPKIGISGEAKTIATISRSGKDLTFSRSIIRSSTTLEHAHQLANCLLKMSCDGQPQYIALRSPVTDLAPIGLSFDHEEIRVPLQGILNWPQAKVVLDLPVSIEQLVAASGYTVEGRQKEVVRIVTKQIDWPNFELQLDSNRRQVSLRFKWPLLASFQGTDRLGQAKRQLVDEEASLNTRKGVLERRQKGSGVTKADYDRLQADIDKITTVDIPEIKRRQNILGEVERHGLDRLVIPYLIAMEVEGFPVLIAKSRQ